ncbi:helix-turn-helix transcriptional regulator [Microbacterium aquilitoris]|uniref:helix-turn-helix transcriptional regulator n=1 Tax=Microbacterium aquilitoris TaxID=3067307 RepID=UPI0035DA6350
MTDRGSSGAARCNEGASSLPRLLTSQQLASYLQIPLRTIEDWRLRQYGPAHIQIGKRVMYREDVVAAWIDELSKPAPEGAGDS